MTSTSVPAPAVLSKLGFHAELVQILGAHLEVPRHAYLFTGPPGSGKEEWAKAFAAALVCPLGGCGECLDCRSVLAGTHGDVNVFANRDGSLSIDDARRAIRYSSLSPSRSGYRVVLLEEFENMDRVAPVLLKAIEEPPPSTVFVLVASAIGNEMATIASRCVKVEFTPVEAGDVAAFLMAKGVSDSEARTAAELCGGSLAKAQELVAGGLLSKRVELWQRAAREHPRSGFALMRLVLDATTFVDEVVSDHKRTGETRLAEIRELVKQGGASRGAVKDAEADLARQLRWLRRSEFELGFSIILRDMRSAVTQVDDPIPGYSSLAETERRMRTAMRRLGAGVTEVSALGAFFGGV